MSEERDPMEELFRKGSGESQFEFQEADWSDLEKRLDRELPTPGSHFWGHVLLGLFIISLPWWPWSIDSKPYPKVSSDVQSQESIIEKSPSTDVPSENIVDSDEATSGDVEVAVDKNADESTVNHTQRTAIASSNKQPKTESNTTELRQTTYASPESNPVDKRAESTVNWEAAQLFPKSLHNISAAPTSLPLWPSFTVNEKPETTSEEAVISTPISNRNYRILSPFLLVGMEYGGTQMDNSPRLGYRAGLGVRYRPFQAFSINAAFLYANVAYTAYGDEYVFANGAPPGIVLDWTDGICEMYEIPIDINWHPTLNSSIGVGVRSYLIQRQEYDLYFHNYSGAESKYNYVVEENHTAWAPHLYFTAGYFFDLWNKGGLEIQPFYQLPLTGIGVGSVEWHSAGASVVVRF